MFGKAICIVLLSVGISACSLNQEAFSTDTPPTDEPLTITVAHTPTPIPQMDTVNLPLVHIDNGLGIEFNYPESWRIEGNPGDLIQLYSPPSNSPNPRPQGGGFPEDETKIEFIANHPGNPYQTLDEWITFQEQPQQGPGGQVLFIERVTLPSGILAVRSAFGQQLDGSEIPSLVIEHNGRLILIAGYGDTTRFDEVVNTIRPAQ